MSLKSGVIGIPCQPVWPDLAKFRQFGNILQVFGQFLKLLISIWQNYTIFGKLICFWQIPLL